MFRKIFPKNLIPKSDNQPFVHNLTDYHSHILPGVDDGVKDIDNALKILSLYENAGLKKLWLTPHIMEDYPNETTFLLSTFDTLKNEYRGNIQIELAAEYMIDELFIHRLANNDLLSINITDGELYNHNTGTDNIGNNENTKLLLVETSYFSRPTYFYEILKEIKDKGYVPLLAHPERYVYMGENDYRRIIDMGVILQLNIASLMGAYGTDAKKRAKFILSNKLYSLSGTDTHSLKQAQSISSELAKIITQ